jgi:hypothetical protein
MSAFYDLASLVVVPSGYKSGKVYAQKPLTTDGQLAFTRASTATRVNASGLIEAVATGVPRLDYLNSTCPKLLLEPQRSNSVTFSEQFNNAAWSKGNTTISANSSISPDGTQNADTIFDDTVNTEHVIASSAISITSNAVTTFSIFLKSGTQPFAMLRHYADIDQYFCVVVNLNTGVITKTQAGSLTSNTSSSIVSYGNGWYKVTATCSFASTAAVPILHLVNSANPSIGSYGQNVYLGNGTNSVLAWGAQFETGAYATSYIPTLGASVTRVADAASKTGVSSLIGQTEGTLFADFEFNGKYDVSGNIPILIYTGTSEAYIFINTSGNLFLDILNAGVLSASISVPIGAVGRKKIAFAYKANDFVGYMNGVQIGTDTSGTVGAMSDFNVGSYRTAGYSTTGGVNQALLFKTRLTNAQLAELTAL